LLRCARKDGLKDFLNNLLELRYSISGLLSVIYPQNA
jgi:hypothetical protein